MIEQRLRLVPADIVTMFTPNDERLRIERCRLLGPGTKTFLYLFGDMAAAVTTHRPDRVRHDCDQHIHIQKVTATYQRTSHREGSRVEDEAPESRGP